MKATSSVPNSGRAVPMRNIRTSSNVKRQRVSKWASLTAIQSKASYMLTKHQQVMRRNFEG